MRLLSPNIHRELISWLRRHRHFHKESSRWDSTDAEEMYRSRHEWLRKLRQGRWVGIAFPECFGGRGLDLTTQILIAEQFALRGAPWGFIGSVIEIVGPVLLRYGTPEQQSRHIPRMLDVDEHWCLGITEPEMGSDFSGAKTTAASSGDCFVVNGRKIWTTAAHRAHYCLLLTRTNPAAVEPWLGLSYLIVSLRSQGVTIRQIPQATGQAEFNEITFNDVKVPTANLLGPLNGGWRISATLMAYESIINVVPHIQRELGRLLASARRFEHRQRIIDAGLRRELADMFIEAAGIRAMVLQAVQLPQDRFFAGAASVAKVRAAELGRRIQVLGLKVSGCDALVMPPKPKSLQYPWLFHYIWSCGALIARGTEDIHHDLIARYTLGFIRGEDGPL